MAPLEKFAQQIELARQLGHFVVLEVDEAEALLAALRFVRVFSFEQFIAHGRANGANIVNGMPWSWEFFGHAVSHENDGRYLLGGSALDVTRESFVLVMGREVYVLPTGVGLAA